jgi:hypothetical protein
MTDDLDPVHWWRPLHAEIPTPPAELVGPRP